MVQINDIQQIDDIVSFTGLPEGKQTDSFRMILDINTGATISLDTEPSIYTQQAKIRIKALLQENNPLPQKTSAYWC